ncbi:MAG: FkbM family methyltransferase [Candidatus Adlerbacteria bacterium]|nr:FkbM family methyltransferase [Candidatus Adlerbacteria bacterium]
MLMALKKFLRSYGYDVVRYHSFYDSYLQPLGIKTVLDIGANTGEFSKEMRTLFPEADIYAFEPLKDCFETIGLKMANDSKFHSFNNALGETTGTSIIQRSSFHPSSSMRTMAELHKELYPKSKDSFEEKIQIARLDDAMKDISVDTPMFIKMDVQGFEDSVIRGGIDTIKKAAVLQVETSFVPLYENQPLFADIHAQLHALGFSYRGTTATHRNPKTGELLYQDSIFVRN